MTLDQAAITRYVRDAFAGVEVHVNEDYGAAFFFYGPERMFPFATLVWRDDAHDAYSRLDGTGDVRLNVGVSKPTFHRLVGPPPADPDTSGVDYAARDRLLPHPVYARQLWLSVVAPGPATWPEVQALLAEAYGMAVEKERKRLAREAQHPGAIERVGDP